MRAEYRGTEELASNYVKAVGRFFDRSNIYKLEVYKGSKSEGLEAKLYGKNQSITGKILDQPKIDRPGTGHCLSISSRDPELPTTDEEIEAYARLLLHTCSEGLEYNGSKIVDPTL